jgi:hypothetical protein
MRVDLDTAAAIGECDKGTIHKWVQRGHINRYRDGDPDGEYETMELLHWVEHRNVGMAIRGMVAANANYRRRRVA